MKEVFMQMRSEEYEGDPSLYLKKYAEEIDSIKYFCKKCNKTWSYKHDQENEVCPECLNTGVKAIIKHINDASN